MTKRPSQTAATQRAAALPERTQPSEGFEVRLPAQRDAPPIPLSSTAVFWQPRHLAASPNLIHLPFLFWLMETVRPLSVVQLGLREGVGFMGLCQAIDKLGLEAVCVGVQMPEGPDAALPEKTQEKHRAQYSDFSFIHKEKDGCAARHMRNARVDVLVIDAVVDEACLDSIQARWQPLLSDNAVLVLHDPKRNFASAEAQQFHRALLQMHASISFPRSETGLDVVLVGEQQPERLRHLAQLDLGAAGYMSARNVFARLGQGVRDSQQTRSKSVALEKAKSALKDMEARWTDAKAAQSGVLEEVSAAHQAEEAQVLENAALQARIFDLSREVEGLRDAVQARDSRISELEAHIAQQQTQHQVALRSVERLGAQNAALEVKLTDRAAQEAQARTTLDAHHRALSDAQAQQIAALQEHLREKQAQEADILEQLAARDTALAGMAREAETQKQSRSDLEVRATERQDEVRALTAHAEALRAKNTQALKERDSLKATHETAQAELQAALEAAQADLSRVQAQHERLVSELGALRDEMTTQIALRDTALAEFAQTAEAAEIHRSELQATVERQRNEVRHLTAQAESRRADDPPQADPPPKDAPESAGSAGELGQAPSRFRRVVSGLARRGAQTPNTRKQVAALRTSALFDADWYAATYPECGGPAKAAAHYLREGAFVGYDPSPAFSTIGYYQRNPDVAESDWAALAHYIAHGQSEGRAFEPLMASEGH